MGSGREDGWRGALRRHWRLAAAASALLLVTGLGAGWAIFADRGSGIALTEDEVQRKVEIEQELDFDPATLRAIGRDEEALLWYGTKQDGKLACVVLDGEKESTNACTPADELTEGILSASVGAGGSDGGTQITGIAVASASGEIVAIFQRFQMNGGDWLSQFEGDERARARELLDDGFQPYSVNVAGYFQDLPVWSGTRFTADGVEQCLIIDAFEAEKCGPVGDQGNPHLEVSGADTHGASWTVELDFTKWGTPYLTVTEKPGQDAGD